MRVDGWQLKFWRYLRETRERPFAWGAHDCVLFAIGALEVQIDVDWRARIAADGLVWTNAREAVDVLGTDGLRPFVERYLGPGGPAAWCAIGDLVLTSAEGRETLCVHDGAQLLGPGASGLERVAMRHAVCGWRVG